MTPTDTVVSEARRVLTECLDAFDDEVAEALMGGSERADSWPDIDVPVEALRTLLAIDRRTATPQSGGVRPWGAEDDYEGVLHALEIAGMGAPYSDVQGNLYCARQYSPDGYRDAEFRDYGLARAVRILCNNAARIRSTLADPIPEAPADGEVEGVAQALRNLAEGAEQEDRTILYKAAAALRRSTETDKPGVREAVLEEGNGWFKLFGDSRLGACATDGCGGQPTWRLEAGGVGSNYCSGCSARIRALSASPLTEEQPGVREAWVTVPREITLEMQKAYFAVIDKNMKRVETDLRFGRFDSNREAYRAMLAAAPLPRSTTGGAK